MQNNANELLTLLAFLMPGVFGNRIGAVLAEVFKVEGGGNGGGGGKGKGKRKAQDEQTLSSLRSMLAPFVLRRLKADVLSQLVDKDVRSVAVAPTDFQRKVYESIIIGHGRRKERQRQAAAEDRAVNKMLDDKAPASASSPAGKRGKAAAGAGKGAGKESAVDLTGDDDEEVVAVTLIDDAAAASASGAEPVSAAADSSSSSSSSSSILSLAAESISDLSDKDARHLFTALRKAASHPLLLRVRYQDDAVLDTIAKVCFVNDHFGDKTTLPRVREELNTYSDFDLHQICCTYEGQQRLGSFKLPDQVLYDSPKMLKLRELLPPLVEAGHHTLIFSQWTRTMDLLEELMRDLGIAYLRLDGSTPVRERQQLIDTFSEGQIPVFILSTKAGGLGINLTQADTVILHDLDFNPENDRQVCARVLSFLSILRACADGSFPPPLPPSLPPIPPFPPRPRTARTASGRRGQ